MALIDDLRAKWGPEYSSLTDYDIADHVAKSMGMSSERALYELGVAQRNEPGFTTGIKQGLGTLPAGAGRLAGMIPGMEDNALQRYGENVMARNPSGEASSSWEGFKNNPWQGVKEFAGSAVGSSLPMLLPYVGPATRGMAMAGGEVNLLSRGLGMARSLPAQIGMAALPAVEGNYQAQVQAGAVDDGRNVLSALGQGAVEVGLGLNPILRALSVIPRGGEEAGVRALVKQYGATPVMTALKTVGKVGAGEAFEEGLQQPMQQWSARQDPTTAESLRDTGWNMFGGMVGGLALGGLGGARMGISHAGTRNDLRNDQFIAPDAGTPTDLLQGLDRRDQYNYVQGQWQNQKDFDNPGGPLVADEINDPEAFAAQQNTPVAPAGRKGAGRKGEQPSALTVESFVADRVAGKPQTSPEEIQFYQNNAEAIEAALQKAAAPTVTPAAPAAPAAPTMTKSAITVLENLQAAKEAGAIQPEIADDLFAQWQGSNKNHRAVINLRQNLAQVLSEAKPVGGQSAVQVDSAAQVVPSQQAGVVQGVGSSDPQGQVAGTRQAQGQAGQAPVVQAPVVQQQQQQQQQAPETEAARLVRLQHRPKPDTLVLDPSSPITTSGQWLLHDFEAEGPIAEKVHGWRDIAKENGVPDTDFATAIEALKAKAGPTRQVATPAQVTFDGKRGIVGNESVLGGLRTVNEDDDIAFDAPHRVGAVVLTGLDRQRDGKKGRASEVVSALTTWADANGKVLVLTPAASGELKQPELIAWYERNGFKTAPDGVMERSPNGNASQGVRQGGTQAVQSPTVPGQETDLFGSAPVQTVPAAESTVEVGPPIKGEYRFRVAAEHEADKRNKRQTGTGFKWKIGTEIDGSFFLRQEPVPEHLKQAGARIAGTAKTAATPNKYRDSLAEFIAKQPEGGLKPDTKMDLTGDVRNLPIGTRFLFSGEKPGIDLGEAQKRAIDAGYPVTDDQNEFIAAIQKDLDALRSNNPRLRVQSNSNQTWMEDVREQEEEDAADLANQQAEAEKAAGAEKQAHEKKVAHAYSVLTPTELKRVDLADDPDTLAVELAGDRTAPLSEEEALKQEINDAFSELGDALDTGKLNLMPAEQRKAILPILSRILTAGFKLGYLKFKDAVNNVRTAYNGRFKEVPFSLIKTAYMDAAAGIEGTDPPKAVALIKDVVPAAPPRGAKVFVSTAGKANQGVRPLSGTSGVIAGKAADLLQGNTGGNKLGAIKDMFSGKGSTPVVTTKNTLIVAPKMTPPEEIANISHREAVEMFLRGESTRNIAVSLGIPSEAITKDLFDHEDVNTEIIKLSHVKWRQIIASYGYTELTRKLANAQEADESVDTGYTADDFVQEVNDDVDAVDEDALRADSDNLDDENAAAPVRTASGDYLDPNESGLQQRSGLDSGGTTAATNDRQSQDQVEQLLTRYDGTEVLAAAKEQVAGLHRSWFGLSSRVKLALLETLSQGQPLERKGDLYTNLGNLLFHIPLKALQRAVLIGGSALQANGIQLSRNNAKLELLAPKDLATRVNKLGLKNVTVITLPVGSSYETTRANAKITMSSRGLYAASVADTLKWMGKMLRTSDLSDMEDAKGVEGRQEENKKGITAQLTSHDIARAEELDKVLTTKQAVEPTAKAETELSAKDFADGVKRVDTLTTELMTAPSMDNMAKLQTFLEVSPVGARMTRYMWYNLGQPILSGRSTNSPYGIAQYVYAVATGSMKIEKPAPKTAVEARLGPAVFPEKEKTTPTPGLRKAVQQLKRKAKQQRMKERRAERAAPKTTAFAYSPEYIAESHRLEVARQIEAMFKDVTAKNAEAKLGTTTPTAVMSNRDNAVLDAMFDPSEQARIVNRYGLEKTYGDATKAAFFNDYSAWKAGRERHMFSALFSRFDRKTNEPDALPSLVLKGPIGKNTPVVYNGANGRVVESRNEKLPATHMVKVRIGTETTDWVSVNDVTRAPVGPRQGQLDLASKLQDSQLGFDFNAPEKKDVLTDQKRTDAIRTFDPALEKFNRLADAVAYIGKRGDEFFSQLAAKIMPYMGDTSFNIVQTGDMVGGTSPVPALLHRSMALFSPKQNGVFVRGGSFTHSQGAHAETVMHEAVHKATWAKVRLGNYKKFALGTPLGVAVQDLYALREHVVSEYNKDISKLDNETARAAFVSVDELLAYGNTTPAVQAFLKSISGLKKKTAWGDFTKAIFRILGLDEKHESALASLIDITDRILDAKLPEGSRDLLEPGQTQDFPSLVRNTAQRFGPQAVQAVDDSSSVLKRFAQSFLSLKDLVDEYKGSIPAAGKWYDAMMDTVMARNKYEKVVEDITENALRNPKVDPGKVNDFISRSTFEQKWGYDPGFTRKVTVDPVMAAAFGKLNPDEQAVVKAVFKHGEDMTNIKNALLTKLGVANLMTGGAGKLVGPYAPLKRFGKNVAVLKSQKLVDAEEAFKLKPTYANRKVVETLKKNPADYVVSYFDTIGQAKKFADANSRQFALTDAYPASQHVVDDRALPHQALQRVLEAAKMTQLPPGAQQALVRLIQDMYIQSLDDHNARTSHTKRENRAGYEKDMLRSFLSHGRAEARFLANMEHGGKVSAQFYAMQHGTKDASGRRVNQTAFNSFAQHYADALSYEETPIQDLLTAGTSAWQLSTSIGYHLQNFMQPIMVSLPRIAADFGDYTGTWSALMRGYANVKAVGPDRVDLSKIKDVGLRGALQKAMDLGLLNMGMEEYSRHLEAFRTGYSAVDKTSSVARNALSKMRRVSNAVEVSNRVASATAAYDMAIKNKKSVAEAQAYAVSIISSTQGDSSRVGAPLLLKKLPKFITQYRKFQFMMAAMYVKGFRQAFMSSDPVERAIGRRMLAYKLFHTAMASGLLGLPLMNLVAMAFAATGDGDEPKDLERSLREMIGDETMANLLLKGAGNYVGLSGKLAEDKIFSIAPYTDFDFTSGKAAVQSAAGLLGPGVSQLMKFADGLGLMEKGEYYKAVEKFSPKGVETAMKAFRIANDGYTLKNGDIMVKPEDIDSFFLALDAAGLKSTELQRIEWLRGQQYEIKKFYQDRTSEIEHEYVSAFKEQDTDTMIELRTEWMALQSGKDHMRQYFGDSHDELKRQPLQNLLKYPSTVAKREKKLQKSVAL